MAKTQKAFVFIPETIGSIVYLSQNLKHLQKRIKASFVLSCMGDDKAYSLIHSPSQSTLADKIALHTLKTNQILKNSAFCLRVAMRGNTARQG